MGYVDQVIQANADLSVAGDQASAGPFAGGLVQATMLAGGAEGNPRPVPVDIVRGLLTSGLKLDPVNGSTVALTDGDDSELIAADANREGFIVWNLSSSATIIGGRPAGFGPAAWIFQVPPGLGWVVPYQMSGDGAWRGQVKAGSASALVVPFFRAA